MRATGIQLLFAICALSLALTMFGFSAGGPNPSGKDQFISRAVAQQHGQVTVRTTVLSDDESQRYFGASLADEGIQPVWLSIENSSDTTLYYLPITTDSSYFSYPEVAQLVRRWWSSTANAATDAVLAREAMPDIIASHQIASGFVFTHREAGLKFLSVGLVSGGERIDFRFIIPLGGRSYAIEKVDFSNLYPPGAIEAVDLAELRARLESLPCCTVDKSGTRSGDPLNLVVVGSGADAIFPFITRGWRLDEPLDIHSMLRSVRAFLFGTEYLTAPLSPLYFFGRTQDISLQKARHKISLRNHLRLWQAPFTIDGEHVWVGQMSRDIGIKVTSHSWYLTTHRISPEVDQDRYYLLQDLVMTNGVSQFGFVRGVGASDAANPRMNLTGDPYVTDGLRLVVFLAPQRQLTGRIQILGWERAGFK